MYDLDQNDMLTLKSQLLQLEKESNFLSIDDVDSLIDSMLEHIGSTDPELRDHLIYPTFIKLIDEEKLTINQFQTLFENCLDEYHLYYKVGEKNTDSVFTRSFSALVIAGLLNKDRQLGFLSRESLNDAFNRSVSYLENEQDTRGYIEEKGWAHSIAHGADMLVALIHHHQFRMENSVQILNSIHNCLFKEATYIDEEDERLVFVLEALLDKNLDEGLIERWIFRILEDLEVIYIHEGFSHKYFRTKFNITNFLKSFYFIIGYQNEQWSIREQINRELKKLHHKLYK